MRKFANISPYMTRPLVIYDFVTAPFWISLYMRKILFYFLSVYLPTCWISLNSPHLAQIIPPPIPLTTYPVLSTHKYIKNVFVNSAHSTVAETVMINIENNDRLRYTVVQLCKRLITNFKAKTFYFFGFDKAQRYRNILKRYLTSKLCYSFLWYR